MNVIFKYLIAIFLISALFSNILAQANKKQLTQTEIVSQAEIAKILTASVKKEFNLTFPVWRMYKCTDAEGQFYLVFTENTTKITADKDTLINKIKAVNLKIDNGKLVKQWEINDFTIKPSLRDDIESSIFFWTKYFEITDIDGDGIIDPILVYGTLGLNGTDDGRIKFLIFYKGKKIAIRHQNGVLDYERNSQIDEAFYSIPFVIQIRVKHLIQNLAAKNLGIFPIDWDDAFKNHRTKFGEKN